MTLGALTGDNGILTKANEAKEKTEIASITEEIQREILEEQLKSTRGKLTAEALETILTSKGTLSTEENILDRTLTTTKGGYEIAVRDIWDGTLSSSTSGGTGDGGETGDGGNPPAGNTIQAGETATGGNKEYTDTVSEKTATIPEGFTVSDKAGETNINNGLVVIGPDGSEFVWVPVDDINTMAKKTSGTDANGNENYQGKLYNFSSNFTSSEMTSYGQGTTSYREPDVVTDYDGSATYLSAINNILKTTSYSTSSAFKTDLQKDYNSMVKSVNIYHGFYVGRYETSLNSSKVAQSKQGVTSSDASQTDTNMWYGLYARQKLYSTSSVQGSMIWGSQWDSMMRWMQSNKIDVTSATPKDAATGITTSKNTTRVTGSASKDKLSNIYDLLGNSYEWTLEADDTLFRVYRGGYYYGSNSPKLRISSVPNNTMSDSGSRLALYLK